MHNNKIKQQILKLKNYRFKRACNDDNDI